MLARPSPLHEFGTHSHHEQIILEANSELGCDTEHS